MTYLARNSLRKINKLLELFPIVLITGARQCGKSYLCQTEYPNWQYFDLENTSDFDFITQDFSFFFAEHPRKVIIDEAQESPELLRNLRGVVDSERGGKVLRCMIFCSARSILACSKSLKFSSEVRLNI